MRVRHAWMAAGILLLLAGCTGQMKPMQTYQPQPRPEVGLRLKVVDAEPYLKDTDMKEETGLLVTVVKPDSAAARAGVQGGDFLLRIDGRRVTGSRDSIQVLQSKKSGDFISFQVLRDKSLMDLSTLLQIPTGKP